MFKSMQENMISSFKQINKLVESMNNEINKHKQETLKSIKNL